MLGNYKSRHYGDTYAAEYHRDGVCGGTAEVYDGIFGTRTDKLLYLPYKRRAVLAVEHYYRFTAEVLEGKRLFFRKSVVIADNAVEAVFFLWEYT